MSQVPTFTKRLESRIALALAKAAAAAEGIASLSHYSDTTNGAPIGPAGTVAFTSPSFTPVTGKVRIDARGFVSGGTAVAGDTINAVLLRDGVAIAGSPPHTTALCTGGTPTGSVSLIWDDVVTPNTAHTWAIQVTVTNGSGHTIEFPIGGGSEGGAVALLVQELPG